MKVSPEQLEAELLQLPPHVRARLAEALLVSLDDSDSELDLAWGEEAERRAVEMRSGQVEPIPAEEARARARSQLR
jgi:putative addiction module component (TIGR02574 family)